MTTKPKIRTGAVKAFVVPPEGVKRGRAAKYDKTAKTGQEMVHYLKEAKEIHARVDKQYVEFRKKMYETTSYLQLRPEEIRGQAENNFDAWPA